MEIKPVNPKGNQPWMFIGRTDVEAETPIFWPHDAKSWLIRKDSNAGKDWRQEEKGGGDGWISSPIQWTRVCANSRSWWRTRKLGMLQSLGLQRVRHDLGEQQQGRQTINQKKKKKLYKRNFQKRGLCTTSLPSSPPCWVHLTEGMGSWPPRDLPFWRLGALSPLPDMWLHQCTNSICCTSLNLQLCGSPFCLYSHLRSPTLKENSSLSSHFLHQPLNVKTACCCCCITSVVSDSVRPHRRQPTRLLRPWDSPGKDTGVGCHFLLQCMKVKTAWASHVLRANSNQYNFNWQMKTSFFALGHRDLIISTPAIKLPKTIHSLL